MIILHILWQIFGFMLLLGAIAGALLFITFLVAMFHQPNEGQDFDWDGSDGPDAAQPQEESGEEPQVDTTLLKAMLEQMENDQPHEVAELMCVHCKARWIAVFPEATALYQIQCKCGERGFVIKTGQTLTMGESGPCEEDDA